MSQNPSWVNILLDVAKDSKKQENKKNAKPKEQIILTTKEEGLLWFEMLKSLSELDKKEKIIPFPKVFKKICTKFSMTKAKAWNCLFFLAEFSLIEIISGHGVRLNYKIINS